MTLNFVTGLWDDNKLFFPAWNTNGLFSYDFIRRKTEFVAATPQHDCKYVYGGIEASGDSIFLSPCNAKSIIEIEKKNWNVIGEYPVNDDMLGVSWARFGNCFASGDDIVFAPYQAHCFMVFNKIQKAMSYVNCLDTIDKMALNGLMLSWALKENDHIWTFGIHTNLLICFDMNTYKCEIYNDLDVRILAMAVGDSCLWLLTDDRYLIKWNPKEGVIVKVKTPLNEIHENVGIIFCKNCVWIEVEEIEDMYIYSDSEGTFIDKKVKIDCQRKKGGGMLWEYNGQIYFIPVHADSLFQIDDKDGTVERHHVCLQGDEYIRTIDTYLKKKIQRKELIRENSREALNIFLRDI